MIKKIENLLEHFKNVDSLLEYDSEKISTLFFYEYLTKLVYSHYSGFYTVSNRCDFCASSNFNELAEYIWSHPIEYVNINERIYEELKTIDTKCTDHPQKAFVLPEIDKHDDAVCKLISNMSFSYAICDENTIIDKTLKAKGINISFRLFTFRVIYFYLR